jgi:hypothetical protein
MVNIDHPSPPFQADIPFFHTGEDNYRAPALQQNPPIRNRHSLAYGGVCLAATIPTCDPPLWEGVQRRLVGVKSAGIGRAPRISLHARRELLALALVRPRLRHLALVADVVGVVGRTRPAPVVPLRKGLHLYTFQLNLSRFGHTSPCPHV